MIFILVANTKNYVLWEVPPCNFYMVINVNPDDDNSMALRMFLSASSHRRLIGYNFTYFFSMNVIFFVAIQE